MMSESEKLLLLNSPKGTDQLSTKDIPDPRFHPSPTMRVRFPNGKVVAMNRQERRHAHLYGDRIKRVKA